MVDHTLQAFQMKLEQNFSADWGLHVEVYVMTVGAYRLSKRQGKQQCHVACNGHIMKVNGLFQIDFQP